MALSFGDLLLPALVADRPHIQHFAPNVGILIVGAGMP
jgi:hypothetical protein